MQKNESNGSSIHQQSSGIDIDHEYSHVYNTLQPNYRPKCYQEKLVSVRQHIACVSDVPKSLSHRKSFSLDSSDIDMHDFSKDVSVSISLETISL